MSTPIKCVPIADHISAEGMFSVQKQCTNTAAADDDAATMKIANDESSASNSSTPPAVNVVKLDNWKSSPSPTVLTSITVIQESPPPPLPQQDDAGKIVETAKGSTIRVERSFLTRPSKISSIAVLHYSIYPDGSKVAFKDLPSYQKASSESIIPYHAYRWSLDHNVDLIDLIDCNELIFWVRRKLLAWLRIYGHSIDFVKQCNITVHSTDLTHKVMDIHWPSLASGAPDLRPDTGPVFQPNSYDIDVNYLGHGARCAPYEIAIKVVLRCNTNILDFKNVFNANMKSYGAIIVDIWRMVLVDEELFLTNGGEIIAVDGFSQWNGTLILLVALLDITSPACKSPSSDPNFSASFLPHSIYFHGESITLHHRQEKSLEKFSFGLAIKGGEGRGTNFNFRHSFAHTSGNAEIFEAQAALNLASNF